MKSFAIYYRNHKDFSDSQFKQEKDEYGKNKEMSAEEIKKFSDVGEFHVNIWKVNEGRINLHPVFYVDLGIKVSFKCEQVRLFVPFITRKDKCRDLCKEIMQHRDLMCAIFNDEMLPTPQDNTCFCQVMSQTNNRSFYLYQLASDNIGFENYFEDGTQVGTYITLTIKGFPTNDGKLEVFKDEQLYLRLRLFVEHNSEFAITEHVSNDLLQAAFSQTDLFDFRFNEKREIDGKVLEKMKTDKFEPLSFDKVHVFYIADTREDVENESSLKIDSRLLEKMHWLSYEPENKLRNTHYVAHHWRKRRKNAESPFNDASVFFSTKYPNLDLWRLISYFSVVVLLGWIGSMLSFDWKCNKDWMFWIKPGIVCCLVLFIIGLVIKVNLEIHGIHINRKR